MLCPLSYRPAEASQTGFEPATFRLNGEVSLLYATA